jgi:hypothetical protein
LLPARSAAIIGHLIASSSIHPNTIVQTKRPSFFFLSLSLSLSFSLSLFISVSFSFSLFLPLSLRIFVFLSVWVL